MRTEEQIRTRLEVCKQMEGDVGTGLLRKAPIIVKAQIMATKSTLLWVLENKEQESDPVLSFAKDMLADCIAATKELK